MRRKKEDIRFIEALNAGIIVVLIVAAAALFIYLVFHTSEAINSLLVTLNREGYSKQKFEIYRYHYRNLGARAELERAFWGKVNGNEEEMDVFVKGDMPPDLVAAMENAKLNEDNRTNVTIDIWYNPNVGMEFRFGEESIRVVPYFEGFFEAREKMLRNYVFLLIAFITVLLALYFANMLNRHYERKSGNDVRPC